MKQSICLLTILICLLGFTSCEKPDLSFFEDDEVETPDGFVRLSFNITHFEQIPFDDNLSYSRASTDVSGLCTRINFAIFSEEGKLNTTNQTIDDEEFGQITVAVPENRQYTVVILAHSGTGNATISKPDSIRFANNKVTDTFFYCDDLTVESERSHEVKLRRAVAKFQLVTEDEVPENVVEMIFKYTGGSSTFDARTGFGKINSRQTETRPITDEMRGKKAEFEIFTFPHEEEDELKITVTATDAEGKTVIEKVFEKVPVKINQITRCTGTFFDGSNNHVVLRLHTDDDWTQKDYQF